MIHESCGLTEFEKEYVRLQRIFHNPRFDFLRTEIERLEWKVGVHVGRTFGHRREIDDGRSLDLVAPKSREKIKGCKHELAGLYAESDNAFRDWNRLRTRFQAEMHRVWNDPEYSDKLRAIAMEAAG